MCMCVGGGGGKYACGRRGRGEHSQAPAAGTQSLSSSAWWYGGSGDPEASPAVTNPLWASSPA